MVGGQRPAVIVLLANTKTHQQPECLRRVRKRDIQCQMELVGYLGTNCRKQHQRSADYRCIWWLRKGRWRRSLEESIREVRGIYRLYHVDARETSDRIVQPAVSGWTSPRLLRGKVVRYLAWPLILIPHLVYTDGSLSSRICSQKYSSNWDSG